VNQPLLAFPQALVDALGIKRGGNLSAYTQIWLVFGISGLTHASGIFMVPSPVNITFDERFNGVMVYFLLQAAAITLEDFVQWIMKSMGLEFAAGSRLKTMLGYAWVIGFFWVSLPQIGNVLLRTRFGEDPMFMSSPNRVWVEKMVKSLQ
jgi:hypothetical protein